MGSLTLRTYRMRLDDVVSPISEQAPCGIDLREEEEFELIEEAVRELVWRPGEEQDYSWVETAEDILTGKSKDLKVLVQWIFGLVAMEGVSGLALGMSALRAILETHWDRLWPRKPRSRFNAISFLANERFLSRLQAVTPTEEDRPWIEICSTELETLKDFRRLQYHVGDLDYVPIPGPRLANVIERYQDMLTPELVVSGGFEAVSTPLRQRLCSCDGQGVLVGENGDIVTVESPDGKRDFAIRLYSGDSATQIATPARHVIVHGIMPQPPNGLCVITENTASRAWKIYRITGPFSPMSA